MRNQSSPTPRTTDGCETHAIGKPLMGRIIILCRNCSMHILPGRMQHDFRLNLGQ